MKTATTLSFPLPGPERDSLINATYGHDADCSSGAPATPPAVQISLKQLKFVAIGGVERSEFGTRNREFDSGRSSFANHFAVAQECLLGDSPGAPPSLIFHTDSPMGVNCVGLVKVTAQISARDFSVNSVPRGHHFPAPSPVQGDETTPRFVAVHITPPFGDSKEASASPALHLVAAIRRRCRRFGGWKRA